MSADANKIRTTAVATPSDALTALGDFSGPGVTAFETVGGGVGATFVCGADGDGSVAGTDVVVGASSGSGAGDAGRSMAGGFGAGATLSGGDGFEPTRVKAANAAALGLG
jgi:hypothetical protein